MSSTSRAWIVAASTGAVEALKDKGICRWNHILRSASHHAKNHMRSVSQAKKLFSQSSAAISNGIMNWEEKSKQSKESLRKVIFGLSKKDFEVSESTGCMGMGATATKMMQGLSRGRVILLYIEKMRCMPISFSCTKMMQGLSRGRVILLYIEKMRCMPISFYGGVIESSRVVSY
ncbi:hypothetical protein CCACVL1_03779 [Corchorus capsularis]|uniref:Wound-responsive family protein n=1 Tax=Corchorus capsularis TaxID=210143 RepID=A0A1R3JXG5_COCAP|nr:hypothetical protein CCACVL1_03779 [Corchorus capsularis]